MSDDKGKQALKAIKEKIKKMQPKPCFKGKETAKLFNRRLSILPTFLPPKSSTSALNFNAKQAHDLSTLQHSQSMTSTSATSSEKPSLPIALVAAPVVAATANDPVFKAPSNYFKIASSGPNIGKKPKLNQNTLQGKNIIGMKIMVTKRSPVKNYYNKNDGSAFVYGFAKSLAFAVVLCDGNECKFLYKCHIPACSFQIMDESGIKKHIEKVHASQNIWNGFCAACSKLYFYPEKENNAVTMIDELEHIKKAHFGSSVDSSDKVVATSVTLRSSSRPNSDPRLRKSTNENTNQDEQFYNSIDVINLRPWLNDSEDYKKSKASALAMLHEDPLAALFKCMQINCNYFTSEIENFRRHLALHQGKSNANLCSYCQFKGTSAESLLKHLQDEHNFDCYQCGFCFYRSFSDVNLITHIRRFHGERPSLVMIECLRRGYKDNKDKLWMETRSYDNITKFVQKFDCPCGSQFFLFKDFEDHVEGHGNANLKYDCKKCLHKINLNELFEHNEKCLKSSCIQCIHCSYGCQNQYKIYDHLSNRHPSKVPMYCDRLESSNNHDTSSPKCLNLKFVEQKAIDNVIIIRKLDTSPVLRNSANVESNIQQNVSSIKENIEELKNSEPLLTINSISSMFSDPSDIDEILAVISEIDSDDIKDMFGD